MRGTATEAAQRTERESSACAFRRRQPSCRRKQDARARGVCDLRRARHHKRRKIEVRGLRAQAAAQRERKRATSTHTCTNPATLRCGTCFSPVAYETARTWLRSCEADGMRIVVRSGSSAEALPSGRIPTSDCARAGVRIGKSVEQRAKSRGGSDVALRDARYGSASRYRGKKAQCRRAQAI